MANTVTIQRLFIAPYGVRFNDSSWAIATGFAATGSGSGWSVGSDLGPTAYADNGAGLVRVTMPSTASLATGDRVYITGTTSAVYDGFWAVTVIDGTHVDLIGSTYSVNPAAKGTLKETLRYVFRVVGWLTADELDGRNSFGLMLPGNPPINGSGSGSELCITAMPTATTNELYISWILPTGIKFHHISIYMQADSSSWTLNAKGDKLLPTSTNATSLYGGFLLGNIPGWATRAIISSPTAHTYTMQQPILEKNLAGDYLYINGNLGHCFYDSTPSTNLVLYDSGADSGSTYSTAGGTYDLSNSDGDRTKVSVAANLADAALGTLQFNAGPFNQLGAIGSFTLATIGVVADTQLQPRQLNEFDFTGGIQSIDNYSGCPIDGLILSVLNTQFSGPADLSRLHWAMQNQYPMLIVTANDDGSIVYAKTWRGRIVGINKTGGIQKSADGLIELQFIVDQQFNYFRDLGWYMIVTATTATRTLTFNGDLTKVIRAGTLIYIKNSTGNDGFHGVESSSYSASSDTTSVVTYDTLADGTDDGYVEVYNI